MSDIVDLDVLLPDDKRVALKGRTYILPGDMPMVTFLRINKISQQQEGGATQEELLGETVNALVELFFWTTPDGTKERERAELAEQFNGMGVRTIMAIIAKVYPYDDGSDEDEVIEGDVVAEDPTPEPGKTTTKAQVSQRAKNQRGS